MKPYINKFILMGTITVVIFSGCKKLVQIDPPKSELVTTSVFNDNGATTSTLLNIYQSLFIQQYNIEWQTGLLSDEFRDFGNVDVNNKCYTNALDILFPSGPWLENYYNYIFQCNAILEALEGNDVISPKIAQQLKGEAKFIRAFLHFYLANCYGDIPLALTTDYTVTQSLSRTPKAQVFQQIIDDLKEAKDLLNSGYVDASDTAVYPVGSEQRVRPTKWAASALLARVYLSTGTNYADAEAEATAVINNTSLFELKSNLNDVFLANSREAIWQLQTPLAGGNNGGINTNEGQDFILTGQPAYYALSQHLLNAFELGDSRRTNWIDSIIVPGPPDVTYYYPYKYKVRLDNDVSNTEEYTMMLRLSEQYLIRAEARANQNNILGAIADLNVLRQRARAVPTMAVPDPLPDLPNTLTQQQTLDAVLHERQVELFTEGGHRWFDMIRMGYVNSIMGDPGNVCQSKGGIWATDGHQALFPVPQSEINKDPNLTQNLGY